MIRITYEFATEDEALRFLARDKAQAPIETVKPKGGLRKTTTTGTESAFAGSLGSVAEVVVFRKLPFGLTVSIGVCILPRIKKNRASSSVANSYVMRIMLSSPSDDTL